MALDPPLLSLINSPDHPDSYPTEMPINNKEDPFNNDCCSIGDTEVAAKLPVEDISCPVLYSEREIVTHIISVDDDPSLNPWTFRALFIGLGLSAFGGSLGMFISRPASALCFLYRTAEIYYFKPVGIRDNHIHSARSSRRQQTIGISLMFLAIISYILGSATEIFIPRHGPFRFLNPVSYNVIGSSCLTPL